MGSTAVQYVMAGAMRRRRGELPRVDKGDKLEPEIEAVFQRILASSKRAGADQLDAWNKPERDFRRLVKRDYVRALRRNVGCRELKTLLLAVEKILARRGGDVQAWGSLEAMRATAAGFPLHFKAEPYGGDEGLALRGFYADKDSRTLRRPLIFVNTSHVPIAVSATFCHEFAHYLTAELLESQPESLHFFYDAAYASHLDDPVELVADAIVALRAYSRGLARQIFKTPWSWGLVGRIGSLPGGAFEQVRMHLKRNTGFDFSPDLPALQNIHYLSGMIHYAKLRWALLVEYDL